MSILNNITALFLQQSYLDCIDEYSRSLKGETRSKWDAVILTASNENQAEGYRKQLASRPLPANVHFAVIPDKNGERIGSGGATLSVIKYVKELFGTFEEKKILVIHSGGDSKRVPSYSALGKLFSPVPHEIDCRALTLFDELLIATSQIPQRIGEGMLLMSGDVLLLFNPLKIDFRGSDAAAISFLEDVETGKNHGVFTESENGNVGRFLHKQTVDTLRSLGAVNERGEVNIDTGAVLFSSKILNALYSLVSDNEDKYICTDTRLSLYADFLYPLAESSTLESFYNEKPEGSFTPELKWARERVWNALRPFRMKLLKLSPAKFVHFGTTGEVLNFMTGGVDSYSDLSWSKVSTSCVPEKVSAYCSVVSDKASVGSGTYFENSEIGEKAKVGNGCFISSCDVNDSCIPDDVVLHLLRQKDGGYVTRIYGTSDNPKEPVLFGRKLSDTEELLGLSPADSLWNAEIYPVCGTKEESLSAALNLYDLCHGEGDVALWKKYSHTSLCSGFGNADPDDIIRRSAEMTEKVKTGRFVKAIRDKKSLEDVNKDFGSDISDSVKNKLLDLSPTLDFYEKIRVFYFLGEITGDKSLVSKCFKETADNLISLRYDDSAISVKEDVSVRLPLRVNFGGGWSDTPPYCMENGGTVLNAAVSHNGEFPVSAEIHRIPENRIVFISRDMDAHGEFRSIEPLQNTGDPYDPFALQKSCLLSCGIIPEKGGNLDEILTRMGGGFELSSEVINVPKGSGLGTSSILSAACAKAVFEYIGKKADNEEIFRTVLTMEQIMSTGGGWQDQVGGLVPGIKLISSEPGIQHLNVKQLVLSDETKKELNDRLCLIWTGQRRLARNLLRSVSGRYIAGEKDSVFALNEIRGTAQKMAVLLEEGNVDGFAELLDYHWTLSKMIDDGSSNSLIESIFNAVDDLISARLVCGAGGGGFLQVILKKGVTKEDLHDRLRGVFADVPIDVWSSEIIF